MKVTKAEVAPFTIVERNADGRRERVVTGYHLTRFVCPGSDEMFERITHPCVFRTEAEAEAFANRVNAPGAGFHFDQWCFEGHICSPLGPTGVAPYSRIRLV